MAVEKTEQIWLDGDLVPWDEAQVHLLTHTLHYGLGAFEGIRCYECADQRSAVFRLREHLERLSDSARILEIDLPYDVEALERVVLDTRHFRGNFPESARLEASGAPGADDDGTDWGTLPWWHARFSMGAESPRCRFSW